MERTSYEFRGKWITAAEFADLEPVNIFHRQLEPLKPEVEAKITAPKNSHILFRKEFEADTEKRTILYISADDYYKLYINGRFVCQGPAPAYPFHYYYNRVDVTDFLKEGKNLIAVHTYYQGMINRVWVSGDNRHGLILDLVQDRNVILSSDESFRCAYHSGFEAMGTVGYETQYMERYRSGCPEEGFELPGYDDSSWNGAYLRSVTDYKLVEQPTKMLEFEEIQPIWLCSEKMDNGTERIVLDFGGIYVGYLYAEAAGENGTVIEVLCGQELEENTGLSEDNAEEKCSEVPWVRWKMRCNCEYREEWILSGGEDKLDQFDYKAFRYAQLHVPAGCTLKHIKLIARHYPFELKANPAIVDEDMQKIWKLCVDSMKYGVQEVIQDCMDREKGNYLGDGCYTALTHYALTKDDSMLKKLIDDSFRSDFINTGLMTCAACSFMQEIAEYPLMVYHMMVRYYELSGDKAYLEQHYRQMCEILDFYKETYAQPDGLLCNLDKWCVVEWPAPYRDGYAAEIAEGKVCTDLHSVINAHYIGALRCMNRISRILGKEVYCDTKSVEKAFCDVFYDKEHNLYLDKDGCDHISLIAQVFPLQYGIYPEGMEQQAEQSILDFIEKKGFTTVMLFGAYPILEGLRRIGRKDIIYRYMSEEGAWKRMLREGATRTFEGWGKDAKWNTSLYHLTLSYGALFLAEL